MLIGIDASRALSSRPTGTETYSRELISALLRLDSPHQFRLYTRSGAQSQAFGDRGNFEVRNIPFPRLWTHVRLSAEMASRAPDVLFVPAHVLPVVHPRRSLVTVHDVGFLRFPRAHRTLGRMYLDLSTRWNVSAASRVLVDSKATRDDLIHFYAAQPEKIEVVYPAISSIAATPPVQGAEIRRVWDRYQIGGDYLLSVGTRHPRKNYLRLLEVFSELPGNYRLVIAGARGWGAAEISSAIKASSVASRVSILDYVDPADLQALYAGALVFVFPSLYEGFGFPVLEAQAHRVPVACSNTSSLPEVAGAGAEFFDPLDTASMLVAITRVLNEDARRQELIEKGCANLTRFSWERTADHLLKVIESL